MPEQSTGGTVEEKPLKSAKKRGARQTLKKIPRKTAQKKKTALKTEAPTIEAANRELEISNYELGDGARTGRGKKVEIRTVSEMPVSPFVIEFRAELASSAPVATKPSNGIAAEHTDPPPALDLTALAEFFGDYDQPRTTLGSSDGATSPVGAPPPSYFRKLSRRASSAVISAALPRESARRDAGGRMSEHAEDRRRPSEARAGGCEGSNRGPNDSESPRRDEQRPEAASEAGRLHLKPFRLPALPTFKLPTIQFNISSPLARATISFALVALLFTMPATGLRAYTKFEQTKTALALRSEAALAGFALPGNAPEELSAALRAANATLLETKTELEDAVGAFHTILPLVPVAGTAYRSGTLLLDAGTHLTEAGRIVTDGMAILSNSTLPLSARLISFEESLRAAFPLIRAAELELNRVNHKRLPRAAQTIVPKITRATASIRASFTQTLELLPALQTFLGTDAEKRYLVLFQNPHELRATGGFVGSFALLDIDRGEVTRLEVPGGGPYDLACCLKEHVIAPDPLHLIEPHWQFHDANWFPDFPSSAKKLIWFYGKSGGPTVDGVIAINATLIPKLLAVLGPLNLPAYNRTFTAENFISETQKIVELEYDREENRPKAVIGDLAPVLLERLSALSPEHMLPVLAVFADALQTKDIQFFSTDLEVQAAFQSIGWAGEVKNTDGDYLMVVSSNIAGGKSNAKIETHIRHEVMIAADRGVVDQVTITKTHTGANGELFSGVRNVDYVRVFVPEGSQLLDARGFESPAADLFEEPSADYRPDEDLARLVTYRGFHAPSRTTITTEHGKTVFGNWMQIDPGTSVTASLTYRLPFSLRHIETGSALRAALGIPGRMAYTFLVQAQSGANAILEHRVEHSAPLNPVWGSSSLQSPLSNDLFSAVLFEQ